MGFGFSGVIPILQTPFHDDGSLDLESLAREVDYVCALGAPGMAFPGFVSEWWKLSQPETASTGFGMDGFDSATTLIARW